MKLEFLIDKIDDYDWLLENAILIKHIIRQNKFNDAVIKKLWEIEDCRLMLIKHQNFSTEVLEFIKKDISVISRFLFKELLLKQSLDNSIIKLYHEHLYEKSTINNIVLWEQCTQQLIECELVDYFYNLIIFKGYYKQNYNYCEKACIHIFEKFPQLLNILMMDFFEAISNFYGLVPYTKRVEFTDNAIDYLMEKYLEYKEDPNKERVMNEILNNLVYYNNCSLHKKATILLVLT